MQNITVKFAKINDEIKPLTTTDAALFEQFKSELGNGETIELYISKIVNEDDKTTGQLAKVHACIRDLARFTGYTFEEMKDTIKEKAGLYDPASKNYKSFADCNKKELSDAIQICIDVGNSIGYYF